MSDLTQEFSLNPEVNFLNFGSFGACPKVLMEDLFKWQRELEFEPVQFITKNGVKYVKSALADLGAYIGCAPRDLVFVPNPTHAMNIVARSFQLAPGDEILSTNLEYGAIDRTWNYHCRKHGATYVRQKISLPVRSEDQIVGDFWKGYTHRTKAVFISHITSATALILPVERICREAKEKGLITIVDGAHVPGQIPLNLADLQADIYTGACHKWMMTAKGSSFLYVKPEMQAKFDPLIVSWGYESQYPSDSQFFDYHQFNGTRDFSAYLTIPRAIAFMKQHNWVDVAARCRKLAHENLPRFAELLGSYPLAPISDEFLGQMCSIPIKTKNAMLLQQQFFDDYKIEIPVFDIDGKQFIRYSINAFNSLKNLDDLYDAIKALMSSGKIEHFTAK